MDYLLLEVGRIRWIYFVFVTTCHRFSEECTFCIQTVDLWAFYKPMCIYFYWKTVTLKCYVHGMTFECSQLFVFYFVHTLCGQTYFYLPLQVPLKPYEGFCFSTWPYCCGQALCIKTWKNKIEKYKTSLQLWNYYNKITVFMHWVTKTLPSSSSEGTPNLSSWSSLMGGAHSLMTSSVIVSAGSSTASIWLMRAWKRLYVRGGWPSLSSMIL